MTLSNAHAIQPTFTAPVLPSTLTFLLQVNDGHGASNNANVTINVIDHAPIANAGPDQSGKNPGVVVTLDGSASSDPDPGQTLTYTWAQSTGLPVTLSNVHAVKPTFTAPIGPSTIVILLTVDDGHGSTNTDSVNIGVTGTPGLDFRGVLTGADPVSTKNTTWTLTVTNVGTVSSIITQANIHPTVTVNGTAVPAAQVTVTSKSKTFVAGDTADYTVTWSATSVLATGANLHVGVCVDLLGDYFPVNNCSAVDQTNGPTAVQLSTPLTDVLHTQTSNVFTAAVKNVGSTALTVKATDITMKVSVNGGAQVTVPAASSAGNLNLAGGAQNTTAITFTWPHVVAATNSSVAFQTCVSVTGQPGPHCTTSTVVVK